MAAYLDGRHHPQQALASRTAFVARWFQTQDILRVCVNADIESVGAVAFYTAEDAVPLSKGWYRWENIGTPPRALRCPHGLAPPSRGRHLCHRCLTNAEADEGFIDL